jgi:hypothetical protein
MANYQYAVPESGALYSFGQLKTIAARCLLPRGIVDA